MSAVADLLARFQADGLDVSFDGMGGNTRAIVIKFGDHARIIVGDKESPFGPRALEDDSDVWGFFARAYRMEGDTEDTDDDSEGWLYCTDESDGVARGSADEGEPVIDLAAEVEAVYEVISDAISEDRVGRIWLKGGPLWFQCAACDELMSVSLTVWNDFRIRTVDHKGCDGGVDLAFHRAHA